tara:strand:+ start:3167 stop:3379 length:213 start_codon:yes stop_codon:yes gene_type:complete
MSKSENTFVMYPGARLEMSTELLTERITRYAKKVSEGSEAPIHIASELKSIALCIEKISKYAVEQIKTTK